MIRKSVIAVISAAVLAPSPTAFAQQTGGTPDEAKSMLMKAVPAVKADRAKALEMFNKGEGRLPGSDLYVFCANLTDGKFVAIGNSNAKHGLGTDSRAARDFAVADGARPRNQVIPSTEMSTIRNSTNPLMAISDIQPPGTLVDRVHRSREPVLAGLRPNSLKQSPGRTTGTGPRTALAPGP
jgi:hypothetical protein